MATRSVLHPLAHTPPSARLSQIPSHTSSSLSGVTTTALLLLLWLPSQAAFPSTAITQCLPGSSLRLTLPRHPFLPDPTPSFPPILPILHSLARPHYCRSHFSTQDVSPKPCLHGLALASSNISLTPNPSLNLGAGTSLIHSFTSPILPTTPWTAFGSLRSPIPFRSWRDPRTIIPSIPLPSVLATAY